MISQVLKWALAGHQSLDQETKEGSHGQSGILHFLHLWGGKEGRQQQQQKVGNQQRQDIVNLPASTCAIM